MNSANENGNSSSKEDLSRHKIGNTKIITDSAADLDPNVAENFDIDIVPLNIRFGEHEFIDGIEISREVFWKKMQDSTELPATSAPSPGRFEEAFTRAAENGYKSAICLCISSKISATYQIAKKAAEDLKDLITIHVIDTQACTIAQGILCIKASNLNRQGLSAEQISKEINTIKERVHLYGALDTLDNLKKGGRIGKASAFFGTLLSIKPIVSLVHGEVQAVAKVRTRSKAIDHLVEILKSESEIDDLVIGHSYSPEVAQLKEKIASFVNPDLVKEEIIGPVVGTHAGPRLLAISFISK